MRGTVTRYIIWKVPQRVDVKGEGTERREHREAAVNEGVKGNGPDGWKMWSACGGRVLVSRITRFRNPLLSHVFGRRRGEGAVRAFEATTW